MNITETDHTVQLYIPIIGFMIGIVILYILLLEPLKEYEKSERKEKK